MTRVRTYKSVLADLDTHVEVIRERTGPGLRMRKIRQSVKDRHEVGGTSDYLIAIPVGSSSEVTRFEGSKIIGTRPHIGSVSISGAEHSHGWLLPEPVDVLHLYLDRRGMERLVEETFDRDGRSLTIEPLWSVADPFLLQIACSADDALRNGADVDLLFLDQLDVLLRTHVLRCHSSVGHLRSTEDALYHGDDPRLRRFVDFVEVHLDRTLRIAELSTVAAMSPSSLMRSFKAATGHSVATYIRERRLQRACALLQTTRVSLAEIAQETGFSDHSHFTRSFKARFGVSPRDWRA